MTRKDFIAFAELVKASLYPGQSPVEVATVRRIAVGMADIFASSNPRFNRSKFLGACGFDA